ncbi:winged helix-turn-helix transcriptional regulator [Thermosipho atlanticus]|uniref:Winged helix-turn-helix DNA-binding n=1 Tax=Thermosipho atlanticus DSM 15807 TaxID=1123380 RepID=A0A1M5QZG3_9BACT|nr:winged helix-turn-helix transcriptional regulator [Thermosipho atlanticus]SHH19557.1 Winged helix-turn-helix DNA-binding [Thermosipho atlanticus DSM 15807]
MVKISNLKFFEPSPYFRKMLILESIYEDETITQKQLSIKVGIVPSLINKYLSELKKDGFITVTKTGKRAKYNLTKNGLSELNLMRLAFFNDIVNLSNQINVHLESIFLKLKGKRHIAVYGAGIVGKTLCELLVNRNFNVVVFFDDDESKIGTRIRGIPVISINSPAKFDALVVASFKNARKMANKALSIGFRDVYIFKTEGIKLIWYG